MDQINLEELHIALPLIDKDGKWIIYENEFCDNCKNDLIFLLKDSQGIISIGLTTLVNCLFLAEKQNLIPKFPSSWWLSLR